MGLRHPATTPGPVLSAPFCELDTYSARLPAGVFSSGTFMLAGLPFILGVQFLLGFVQYDVASAPRSAVHANLLDLGR